MAKEPEESGEKILKAAVKVQAKNVLRSEGPKGVMAWLKSMPAESRRTVTRDINW